MTPRRLILLALSLLAVLAAFGGYFYYTREERRGLEPKLDAHKVVVRGTFQPVAPDMNLGKSKAAQVPIIAKPHKGKDGLERQAQQQGKIQWDSQEPLGQGRFKLERPQLWMFMRDGRLVYVESNTGVIEVSEGASTRNFNPKRGTLIGDVRIMIDNNPNPPPDKPPAERPEDVIRIQTETLDVDYPDNLLESSGRIRLESARADVTAEGLVLRWDAVNRQIVDMQLNTQSRLPGTHRPAEMLIRQGLDMGRPERTREAGEESQSARRTAPSDATPPSDSQPDDPSANGELGLGRRPAVNPAKVQTYEATFHRNVRVVQGYQPARPKEFGTLLTSDQTVTAIFDFAPQRTDKESAQPGAKGGGAGPADAKGKAAAGASSGETPTTGPADAAGDHTYVTWDGVLTMTPLDRSEEPDRVITGLRRQLRAKGERVVMLQRDGRSAICRELAYDTETRIARMEGSDREPAVLSEPQGQLLECRTLILDQNRNVLLLPGPGRMLAREKTRDSATTRPGDEPARQDTEVKWAGQAEVLLGAMPAGGATTRPGGATGERRAGVALLAGAEQTFVRQATFRGAVHLRQTDQEDMRADTVTVHFHPPGEGVDPNQIDCLDAEGRQNPDQTFADQVRVARTDTTVLSDRMTMQMQALPNRTTAPLRATATGRVRAERTTDTTDVMEAARMELTFGPKNDLPIDATTGRGDFEPVEIQAFKDIRLSNAQRGTRGEGYHLYSLVNSDRVTLTGNPARIETPTQSISGPIIEYDQRRQTARVLGAGTIMFISDRGLAGEATAAKTPVNAAWSVGMNYDGATDIAVLRGEVRAWSGRTFLQSEVLRLYLEDRPTTAPEAEGGPLPARPRKVKTAQPPSAVGAQGAGGNGTGGAADGQAATAPDEDAAEPPLVVQAGPAGSPVAATAPGEQTLPPSATPDLAAGPTVAGPTTAPAAQARPDPAGDAVTAGPKKTGPAAASADPYTSGMGAKQLVRVIAEKNVKLWNSEVEPATNRLLQRMWLSTEQLVFHNATRQADANGAGQMLQEDYRGNNGPADQPTGPPGRGRPARPNQIAFLWTRAMQFKPQDLEANFDGDVRMAYRGPDAIAIADDGGIVIDRKAKPTDLNCRNLLVHFTPGQAGTTQPTSDSPAAAADRIRDVRDVLATGDVVLRQADRTAAGQSMRYDRVSGLAVLEGNASAMEIAPDGSRMLLFRETPRIEWNLETNEMQVPGEVTVIGNPPGAPPKDLPGPRPEPEE